MQIICYNTPKGGDKMLRFKCLVLDHDDTVVQSEKTIGFPCFVQTMAKIRPEIKLHVEEYVRDCQSMGFYDLCRVKYGFSEAELQQEYADWKAYIRTHIPDPFPGIESVIQKQKANGGILCVVSHSTSEIITRDYLSHFGILPDDIYACEYPEHQQKPNPYPLHAIMQKYSLKPDEMLVLDDSKIGYDMAAAAGVPSAFAAWGKEGYDDIIKQLRGLCDYTFTTPRELTDFLFPCP